MTIKYTIIIPTILEEDSSIRRLLGCISQNNHESEIIIIFQGKNKKSFINLYSEYKNTPGLIFLYSNRTGISIARNIGIKKSRGDWIILLDDDVYIEKNFFSKIKLIDLKKPIIYYGNVFVNGTLKNYVPFYIECKDLNFFSYNRVCSVSLIISREVFNTIGYFDENIGAGKYYGSSEESDLILRALLNNIKVSYISNHYIWHPKPNFSLRKVYRYSLGLGALYKKHYYSAPLLLKIKFLLDILLRIVLLMTFKPKRFVFLFGFFRGIYEFKK